jgi:serine/threonine-protein kinase
LQREKEEQIKLTPEGGAPAEALTEHLQQGDLPIFDDRYETIELIGQGGMGAVYKVQDKTSNSFFAIKLLKAELASDHVSQKRFEKEAEAASRLTHENLVTVYDYGSTRAGIPYIVMELVGDRNLGEVLKTKGAFPVDKALPVFMQICEALSHAHKNGIIHRDLKPSNIVLTDGESVVKVADFGIASIAKENTEGETLTKTGDIVGSPQYMSPEQCVGQPLDARSDIYSMGCVMYSTLTGKPPFDGGNPVQIILKHINEKAPALPKSMQGGQFSELQKVIQKCLEKEKVDRYATIDELKADLSRVAQNEPVKYIPEHRKWKRRKRLVSFSVIFFAALLCASIGIYRHLQSGSVPPFEDERAALDEGRALQHFKEAHYEQAIPLLEYVAATAHRKGELYREAFDYQCIGQCYLALKEYKKAERYYVMSLEKTIELEKKSGGNAKTMSAQTETKTGYIAVLRALGRADEAMAVLKTLTVDGLQDLEDFYERAGIPNDKARVRGLREELQRLNSKDK